MGRFLLVILLISFLPTFVLSQSEKSEKSSATRSSLILAVDPTKPEVAEKELVWAKLHDVLGRRYKIYDMEGKLREELMESGTFAGDITEDFLFNKFHQADLCLYVWSESEITESSLMDYTFKFYWGRVGCRLVDTLTKREYFQIVKETKSSQQGSSDLANQRRAMKKTLRLVQSELAKKIGLVQHKQSKRIIFVKGALGKSEDREKLRQVLLKMERKKELKHKVVTDSSLFEYKVFAPKLNESKLAELIQQEASLQGLSLSIRSAKRLIQITKPE